MSRVCKMEQRKVRDVRKMLKVEREEIVVLRLYENKRRKIISQMRLSVIVIVCKSLIEENMEKRKEKKGSCMINLICPVLD